MDLEQIKLEAFAEEFAKLAASAEDVQLNIFNRAKSNITKHFANRKAKRELQSGYKSYLREGNPNISLEEYQTKIKNKKVNSEHADLLKGYEEHMKSKGGDLSFAEYSEKVKNGEILNKDTKVLGRTAKFLTKNKKALAAGALALGGVALLNHYNTTQLEGSPEVEQF